MVAITALNGRLPASALTSVSPGRLLRLDAAASYLRARAAGCPAGITDAYRDYATQVKYALKPPNSAGLAAKPGTSQHGEGVALDLPSAPIAWMVAHGVAFGWVRTIPAESWHFEYVPTRDQHATEGDDMPYRDWPKEDRDALAADLVSALLNYRNPTSRPTLYRYIIDAGEAAANGGVPVTVDADALGKEVAAAFVRALGGASA